jgi:hypothetical protein
MTNEKKVEALVEQYKAGIGNVEGLEPVRARMTRAPRHVFSLRIGADELDTIAEAAEKRGISVGDFIRQAALKEASAGGDSPSLRLEEKLDELLRLVQEASSAAPPDATGPSAGRSPGRGGAR